MKMYGIRVSTVAPQVKNLTSIHEDVTLTSGLWPRAVGERIQRCHELWCRSQARLSSGLLWLWHREAAAAPSQPLAWERPYATGMAFKRPKKEKKN